MTEFFVMSCPTNLNGNWDNWTEPVAGPFDNLDQAVSEMRRIDEIENLNPELPMHRFWIENEQSDEV